MFGTIILDAYSVDEVKNMSSFIDEICSPLDNYGWSSAGIYCFWNYYTKEILYIGLASNLSERFMQHNGLRSIKGSSNKYQLIQDYFSIYHKIGYTMLVQSPLSQPLVQHNKRLYTEDFNVSEDNYIGNEALEYIRTVEGQLLESYLEYNGAYPAWNLIGGDVYSRQYASPGNYSQIIKSFSSGDFKNPIVSKSTLRELATNPTFLHFEIQLHGLRMMMLSLGMSYNEVVNLYTSSDPRFKKILKRMKDEGYVDKELILL